MKTLLFVGAAFLALPALFQKDSLQITIHSRDERTMKVSMSRVDATLRGEGIFFEDAYFYIPLTSATIVTVYLDGFWFGRVEVEAARTQTAVLTEASSSWDLTCGLKSHEERIHIEDQTAFSLYYPFYQSIVYLHTTPMQFFFTALSPFVVTGTPIFKRIELHLYSKETMYPLMQKTSGAYVFKLKMQNNFFSFARDYYLCLENYTMQEKWKTHSMKTERVMFPKHGAEKEFFCTIEAETSNQLFRYPFRLVFLSKQLYVTVEEWI